jgi:hypothetical protein
MDALVGRKRPADKDLARMHFGSAQLHDRRLTARLQDSAGRILEHPGGTLPKKLGSHAELIGTYRLLDSPSVTHEAVQRPHRDLVRQRMSQHDGGILLIHDTTELDYTNIAALKDQLGQIGNGSRHGLLCHNTLAVTPDRRVLGLPGQVLHRRRKVPGNETPAQKRDHPDRESLLWLKGCECLGPAPAGCSFIDIADRGADAIEFIEHAHLHGRKYVIRSCRDRKLDGLDHIGSDRIHQTLHEYARDLPSLAEQTLEVRASVNQAPRTARLSLSAGPLQLRAGRFARGHCVGVELHLWVIRVMEIDPPPGVKPLEWILLSNLPVHAFQQAREIVAFYSCRPMVEDFHKGLKTGLGIESLQLEARDRLEPMIGILSVVGAVLLELRDLSRQTDADQIPATWIVPKLYVQVLSGHWYKKADDQMSLRQFVRDVARLGGFLARKGDGPPGWQTLWQGWSDLNRMVQGALALKAVRCV